MQKRSNLDEDNLFAEHSPRRRRGLQQQDFSHKQREVSSRLGTRLHRSSPLSALQLKARAAAGIISQEQATQRSPACEGGAPRSLGTHELTPLLQLSSSCSIAGREA